MKKITTILCSLMVVFALQAQSKKASKGDAVIYNASTENSTVNWEGKKVTGSHVGTIDLSAANFIMSSGKLIGGYVIIDMTTIKNTDLGEKGQAKLEGHLSSADFFDVAEHPEASITITEISKSTAEGSNYLIKGNLTIKEKTHPTEFPVMVTLNDNDGLNVTGSLTFDRSLYDVKYGSIKFFEDIGDKIIYDDITLLFDVNSTK